MTAANHAGHMVAPLLQELKNSEQIIIAMLNAMTTAQKSKVHAQLEADGVSVEGMTRHHERRAAIAAAEAALAQPAAEQVQHDPLGYALDAVNVAGAAASFLNDNIHPVMSALIVLSKFDSTDVDENRSRMGLIRDLAKLGRYLVEDAAGCMEADEDEMQSKPDLLQGGAP
jgi:hypothetical protein